jgi:hypothetical protein
MNEAGEEEEEEKENKLLRLILRYYLSNFNLLLVHRIPVFQYYISSYLIMPMSPVLGGSFFG